MDGDISARRSLSDAARGGPRGARGLRARPAAPPARARGRGADTNDTQLHETSLTSCIDSIVKTGKLYSPLKTGEITDLF